MLFALLLSIFAFTNEDINVKEITPIGEEGKITFLYIDDSGCQYCRKLDVMLQEGKVAELIAEHFVIKREMLDEDLYLPEGLPVPFGTPTVYFLDEHEQALIEPMRGEKTEEDLIFFLEEAISEYKRLKGESSGGSFWDRLMGKED